ncbi:hypothetical protein JAAARDRAFT_69216 [Jaapia argillacea MUCL 33604]|uniref:Malate dehydrogenase n=1 Tax=Jaapia argillacea MUCL 33604 TaxID=933084 RepID=A0A067Q5L8_9AGAM|nr:hypothetical protein JAAARDRAFT_69216 [Jaapia argillacea MUCL 33604]
MFALSSVLSLLVALPAVFAAPSVPVGCDPSGDAISIPSNQTQLWVNSTVGTPSFIALGVGVQNYTCGNTSTYTNVGAVAELFDISCLYHTPIFTHLSELAYDKWNCTPEVTASDIINDLSGIHNPIVLGQHYYVTNPVTGTGISPKWDFTSASESGNPNAFVVAAKIGDLPAPTGKTDVDWVQLKAIQGDLASYVFRVATKGGQPPASCTPGSPLLSVKYTAQYWLYGGSVKK